MRAKDSIGFNLRILGIALKDPRGCLQQKLLLAGAVICLLLPNDLIPGAYGVPGCIGRCRVRWHHKAW